MSASQLDPHDKMRSRDVNKVARGEQAPRPAHEYGTVSEAPARPTSNKSKTEDDDDHNKPTKEDEDDNNDKVESSETAPLDARFPFMNQTRHCYARYVEYHKCIREKGKNAPECEKFAKYCRSLCPSEWIENWNEQRELGTLPGPI